MGNDQKYKVSFEADFKGLVKNAQEASSKMEDLFAAAIKQGVNSKGLQTLARDLEKSAKKEAEVKEKIEKRLAVKKLRDLGREAEVKEELAEELADLEKRLNNKTIKVKEKIQLTSQKKVAQQQLALFTESAEALEKGLNKAFEELTDVVHGMKKAEKSSKVMAWYLEKTSKEFAETITGVADNFGSKLTGSIDSGAIARSLGAALGKGLGSIGDKAGGAFKMLLGPLGAIIGMLGVFAGVMFDTDKKIKEFNRSTVKTFGALTLASLGSGDLSKGLRILNHTVTDLMTNFGVNQEEAMALFDALDKGGITLDRLTRGSTNAAVAQRELSTTLADIHRVANATGVGLTEYADNLTNYVNDLGMSLETVNNSFATISKMASQSAFGTRRFYSMVVQATAGQSSLNVRLEDTADLLMKMTKIMGAKKATEMVGQYGGDLSQMNTQERMRTALVGGRATRRVIGREAVSQARSLGTTATSGGTGGRSMINDLTVALGSGPLVDAIERAGTASSDQAEEASQNLIHQMNSMSHGQQAAMVNTLTSSSNPQLSNLGRQMEQMVKLARATQGGIGAQTNAFQALGPRGSIALRLATIQEHFGRGFDELSGAERAGAEAFIGVSGPQSDALSTLAFNMRGGFTRLQALQARGNVTAEENSRMASELGAEINSSGEVVSSSTGQVISDSNGLLLSYMQQSGADEIKTRDEQTELAFQTMEATTSLADVVENKLLYYTRSLYENVGEPLIQWLGKQLDPAGEARRAAATEIRGGIREELGHEQEAASNISGQIKTREREASSADTTIARKRVLQGELTGLRGRYEESRRRRDTLTDAQRRLSTGDMTGVERTVTVAPQQQDSELLEGGGGVITRLENMFGVGDAARTPGRPTTRTTTASPTEYLRNLMSGAGVSGRTVADVMPGGGAPSATPEASNRPSADATAITDTAQAQGERALRETKRVARAQTRLFTGNAVGDALGNSSLPMDLGRANAQANYELQLRDTLVGQDIDPDTINRIMQTGSAAGTNVAGDANITRMLGTLNSARASVAPAAHDFVYQNGGGRPIITPIDREDQVVGSKPGGPIARSGGGGNVHVNIYGGDERRVYDVVRRVLQQSGIQPNRVGSNA